MFLLIAAVLAASPPAPPQPPLEAPPHLAHGSAAFGAAEVGGWQASLDDARWTGSLLATSGETLPKGHVYFEPYLYDVVSHGHQLGSQSYIEYGVADNLTVGVIPVFALFSGPP